MRAPRWQQAGFPVLLRQARRNTGTHRLATRPSGNRAASAAGVDDGAARNRFSRSGGPLPCGRDMPAVAPIRVLCGPAMAMKGRAWLAGRISRLCRPGGSVPSCRPARRLAPDSVENPDGSCAWGSGGRVRSVSSPEKRGVEDVPSRAGRISPTSSTPLLFSKMPTPQQQDRVVRALQPHRNMRSRTVWLPYSRVKSAPVIA